MNSNRYPDAALMPMSPGDSNPQDVGLEDKEAAGSPGPDEDRPASLVHPHSELLSHLEALATRLAPDVPLVIEAGQPLPVIEHADSGALPAILLEAWESALSDACPADDDTARWLLTQVLALRLACVGTPAVHELHRMACGYARRGEELAAEAARPRWQARSIELDLALARRLSGASRLFALRDMATRHAACIARGAGAVLKAWIEVLLYAARQQTGDVAIRQLAEAATMAERLRDVAGMTDEGEYLLARALHRRARTERGDTCLRTLASAQCLLEALFARAPEARYAMAIAEVALEQGRAGPAQTAKETFSHALTHAFIAGCDPRWQAASLRCRLTIQLAYEALPEMSPQGSVALDLARKLERCPLPPAATIQDMTQTFLRHGEYARAGRLCARAWLAGARFRTLSAAWRQAGAEWRNHLTSTQDHADWQENEARRRIASRWQ